MKRVIRMESLHDTVAYYDEDNQPKLKKADLGMRYSAFMIDHIIITTVLVVPFCMFAFSNIQNDPAKIQAMFPVLMWAAFLVECLKDIIKGASPGKRMLGLAVRSSDSLEIPPAFNLFVRNVLTFVWPLEFLVLVCSAKKTKIGDKLAGTDVYRVSNKPKVLLIAVSAILIITIFVTAIFWGIDTIMKDDISYKTAISYIETDSETMDMVGDIQGYGFIPSGRLYYSEKDGQAYGEASYIIKVIGSQGKAYVHIQLEKEPDKDWEIIYYDCRK